MFGKSTNEDIAEEDLAARANDYYGKVIESMQQGDWTGIGDNLELLGSVLEQMIE